MRPQLKTALRWMWRDTDTVQIGVDPEHAVVLRGMSVALSTVIKGLDGRFTEDIVLARAAARGVDDRAARAMLRALTDGGAIADAEPAESLVAELPPAERDRLAPDIAADVLVSGDPRGFLRRRSAHVAVHGAGRVGSAVATLLAAAGIGRITVVDRTPARPADVGPAGLRRPDVGEPRAVGACRTIGEVAPSTTAAPVTFGTEPTAPPDIAVLAPDQEPDRRVAATLLRAGVPHLVVRVREAQAIVGPFVLPARTSCLNCHDMVRTMRDPAWPTLLAQLLAAPPKQPACDIVLATAAASVAAAHVRSYLEGGEPDSIDGTVELRMPLSTQRRRSWAPHPGCPCQYDPEPAAED